MESLNQIRLQARKYIGQAEIPGPRDNQFILDCFKHTTYKGKHDEVPWCAAFVCRILDECGLKSSRSASADSYESWGQKSELVPGAIVVFQWADGSHHVSIVDSVIDSKTVGCIGGNQSNCVKVSKFARKSIVAIRAPKAA